MDEALSSKGSVLCVSATVLLVGGMDDRGFVYAQQPGGTGA
jgi:hypothetical protein